MQVPRNFADRLLDEIDEKQNPSCIGLDIRVPDLPRQVKSRFLAEYGIWSLDPESRRGKLFQATADAIFGFNKAVIDATCEIVPAYKPNIAFYEKYGSHGIRAFEKTVGYIKSKGCLALTDAKRGDIGDTSEAYAEGHLGAVELLDGSVSSTDMNADAITVVAYVGSDGVRPFFNEAKKYGKGVIVLAKTSNDSSGELQDLALDRLHGGRRVFEEMALRIHIWGEETKGSRGYSSVLAVVGANYPQHAESARIIMEKTIILVPAYGFQGARGIHCMPNFNKDGYGALVNSARDIIFAYKNPDYMKFGEAGYAAAARQAALDMKADLHQSLKNAKKFPW